MIWRNHYHTNFFSEERNNKLTARIDSINKMLEDLLKREREQKERVNKLDEDLKKHEQEYQKVMNTAIEGISDTHPVFQIVSAVE